MVNEENSPRASDSEAILQQQYLRALGSFEGIVLSQIDVKNKLGDRLNYSIRTGIIILGVIALSILILLLTLTSQVMRISQVVEDMNHHFSAISVKMDKVKLHMQSMEPQVAQIEQIDTYIDSMDDEMVRIRDNMANTRSAVAGVRGNLSGVRANVGSMTVNMGKMNLELQTMSREMHHMAKPARTINKMFPFPFP